MSKTLKTPMQLFLADCQFPDIDNQVKAYQLFVEAWENGEIAKSDKKDKNFPSSKNKLKKEENVKSNPLIIFGFIISLTSIFLLLFTINNRFG